MKGYINEIYIVNYLNGRKVKDLNILYLEMIETLFKNISSEDRIKS